MGVAALFCCSFCLLRSTHSKHSLSPSCRRAPDGILGKPAYIVTKQQKKLAHSVMERRYRRELNIQIGILKQLVMPNDDNSSQVNKMTIMKHTTGVVINLRQQFAVSTCWHRRHESLNIPLFR